MLSYLSPSFVARIFFYVSVELKVIGFIKNSLTEYWTKFILVLIIARKKEMGKTQLNLRLTVWFLELDKAGMEFWVSHRSLCFLIMFITSIK